MLVPEHLAVAETDRRLNFFRQSLAGAAYPGYPNHAERLFGQVDDLRRAADGRLVVPPGSWQVDLHPNRQDVAKVPTEVESALLQRQGYELDSIGRPLHPLFAAMLEDPATGIVTGKGAYWRWGPNSTVDPIVIWRNHLLLIQRGDTGEWALPGGFIDHGELAAQAGPREVHEETGIILPASVEAEFVYQGPVADKRTTANAWAETTALLYRTPDEIELPAPVGMDDARAAAWVALHSIGDKRRLAGSHGYLLELAQRTI